MILRNEDEFISQELPFEALELHLKSLTTPSDEYPNGRISLVGFSDLRYVSAKYFASWSIQAALTEREAPVALKPARLWYDIKGQTVDHVLQSLLKSAVSVIHDCPGIYEVRFINGVLTL